MESEPESIRNFNKIDADKSQEQTRNLIITLSDFSSNGEK